MTRTNCSDSPEIDPKHMLVAEAMKLNDRGKMLYFDRVWLRHPRIDEVLSEMVGVASLGLGDKIALLIGPAGVGKSTLITSLREKIIKDRWQEIEADPSFIPVVAIDAPASGEVKFSWKMLYLRLGTALNEPLLDRKVETHVQDGRTLVRLGPTGSTVAGLRVSIENILIQRRTVLVVVDEAVHMLRNAGNNELPKYMDSIKALTSHGLTLALVGSYDLHEVAELSAQVARRTKIIHFSRYLTGVEADERAWRTTLKSLQNQLPLAGVPDLLPKANKLQIACAGCIGILKTTLMSALENALLNGGKWSESCLQKALLTEKQLDTILTEILEGEDRIGTAASGSSTFEALIAKTLEVEAKIRNSV